LKEKRKSVGLPLFSSLPLLDFSVSLLTLSFPRFFAKAFFFKERFMRSLFLKKKGF